VSKCRTTKERVALCEKTSETIGKNKIRKGARHDRGEKEEDFRERGVNAAGEKSILSEERRVGPVIKVKEGGPTREN